jgi:hypothetical protein
MGDPGLFGFLGKVGKAALGGAIGLVTGGPGGAVAGATSAFLPSSSSSIPIGPGPGIVQQPVPGLIGKAQRFVPGGATGFESVACPRGFHPNKADYWLQDGTYVPKGSRCVKNRSRDPLNPRALRRAVARVDADKTWQSKLSEIETGKYTKAGNRKG